MICGALCRALASLLEYDHPADMTFCHDGFEGTCVELYVMAAAVRNDSCSGAVGKNS